MGAPIDYFAHLAQPRRPWLDAAELQNAFRARSTEMHPDRCHAASPEVKVNANAAYANLNAAYQCLRDPKDRLRHLIELERGAKPKQVERIPPDLMDLFLKVGQSCQSADRVVAEQTRVTSPLIKAQGYIRVLDATDHLQHLQGDLRARREALLSELQEIDRTWDRPDPSRPWDRLEEIYRLLGYLGRWSSQLHERIANLAALV